MFNLFEMNSNLKKLQKNAHRILRSDLVVFVFGLIEEENLYYKEGSQLETKVIQTEAY